MRYKEYQPPTELAPWIKLFWVFESRSNEPAPETIVADGYPELIIHFRLPYAEVDAEGRFQKQGVALACGQLTRPLVLHSSVDAGMIGIRFQPSGMAPFVSASMQSLIDARISAEQLFSDLEPFVETVIQSANDHQRVRACCQFLKRSFRLDRENASIRRALELVIQRQGDLSVDSLATMMGTSRRNLELQFQKEVGTSPKMYCRIVRFRHLFDRVSDPDLNVNWVQLAMESGFFDQSHLIRDFRRFAGDAPTAFLAKQPQSTLQ